MKTNALRKIVLKLVALLVALSAASTCAIASSGSGSSPRQKRPTAGVTANQTTARALDLALAELEHAREVIKGKDELLAAKDQTIDGQINIISLKDQQMAVKDQIIAEKDLQLSEKDKQIGSLTAGKQDCEQDRQRVIGERDSARRQTKIAAVAGAVLGALLTLGR